MIEFLSGFWDVFIYPVSLSMEFDNPVYWAAYAVLICAGVRGYFCPPDSFCSHVGGEDIGLYPFDSWILRLSLSFGAGLPLPESLQALYVLWKRRIRQDDLDDEACPSISEKRLARLL